MRLIAGSLVCVMLMASSARAEDAVGVTAELLNIAEARFRTFGEDAKHQFSEKKLTATVVLTGDAAKTATHWGHVVLETVRDDAGTDLKLQSGYKNAGESWVEINREHMWFFNDNPPDNAIKVELEIDPSTRGAKVLTALKGNIQLKASQVGEAFVSNIGAAVGKPVEAAALQAAGVSAVVESFTPDNPGELIKVKVDGPEEAVQAVELVDPAGERIDAGRMWFRMGQSTTYTLSGDKKLGDDVRLRIAVETSNDVTVVPFSFNDVPLP